MAVDSPASAAPQPHPAPHSSATIMFRRGSNQYRAWHSEATATNAPDSMFHSLAVLRVNPTGVPREFSPLFSRNNTWLVKCGTAYVDDSPAEEVDNDSTCTGAAQRTPADTCTTTTSPTHAAFSWANTDPPTSAACRFFAFPPRDP